MVILKPATGENIRTGVQWLPWIKFHPLLPKLLLFRIQPKPVYQPGAEKWEHTVLFFVNHRSPHLLGVVVDSVEAERGWATGARSRNLFHFSFSRGVGQSFFSFPFRCWFSLKLYLFTAEWRVRHRSVLRFTIGIWSWRKVTRRLIFPRWNGERWMFRRILSATSAIHCR